MDDASARDSVSVVSECVSVSIEEVPLRNERKINILSSSGRVVVEEADADVSVYCGIGKDSETSTGCGRVGREST